MKSEDWIKNNRASFDSQYEAMFAQQVLPLVEGLKWVTVTVQHPFVDSDGMNRYCDFTIVESQSVRVAIEIDGYDKRGTGTGMSHDEFLDWQRRQASLASQGWYVLRFANRDVRDAPQLCAKHISELLNRLRLAQTGRTEIVTIQSKPPVLATASPIAINLQASKASGKFFHKAIFIGCLICVLGVALWQTSIPNFMQETLAGGESVAKQTDKKTPLVYGSLACKQPQEWFTAQHNIGQVVTVIGPLLDSRPRPDIPGSPLWIDVGNMFPERNRLTLVLWGKNWPMFDMREFDLEYRDYQMDGSRVHTICITGLVSEYKGVPQIELYSPDQIRIVKNIVN